MNIFIIMMMIFFFSVMLLRIIGVDDMIQVIMIVIGIMVIFGVIMIVYDDFDNLFNIEKEKNVENSYDKCYNDLISKMYDNETAEKLCEIQIENRGK